MTESTEVTKPKKERLEPYLDDKGKRRDPNRDGHPVLCNGHSKRTKKPCGNIAMKNGKCRNHGGASTGPRTAEGKRKIAETTRARNLKTGETAPIWYDMLTDEEKNLMVSIPNDAESLLLQDIQLTTIRERRMMNHIRVLQEYLETGKMDTSVQESWKRYIKRDKNGAELAGEEREDGSMEKSTELVMTGMVVVKDDPRKQIQSIEDALTRVQSHKHRMIEMLHKLSSGGLQEQDGSLQQLNSILGDLRAHRKAQRVRQSEEESQEE